MGPPDAYQNLLQVIAEHEAEVLLMPASLPNVTDATARFTVEGLKGQYDACKGTFALMCQELRPRGGEPPGGGGRG